MTTKLERVSFRVADDRVVADLHLPDAAAPRAAVVVAGPMTSVKEQVTGTYARALAARGFAALALDHRGYGESEGAPRQYEHAGRKVEDLRAALAHLSRRPDVDARRIGLVGVCLGVGYAVTAAIDQPLVKAVGAVCGYYRDPGAMRARDAADFDAKVRQGVDARLRYEATGEVATVPAVALSGDAAMMTADTFDYYARRAAVPNYINRFAVMSREHFLPFDVQAAAPKLAVPLLMIHSDNALSPAWARQFHERVTAPKSLVWTTSRGQTDFYDDPALVEPAADALAGHLRAHL